MGYVHNSPQSHLPRTILPTFDNEGTQTLPSSYETIRLPAVLYTSDDYNAYEEQRRFDSSDDNQNIAAFVSFEAEQPTGQESTSVYDYGYNLSFPDGQWCYANSSSNAGLHCANGPYPPSTLLQPNDVQQTHAGYCPCSHAEQHQILNQDRTSTSSAGLQAHQASLDPQLARGQSNASRAGHSTSSSYLDLQAEAESSRARLMHQRSNPELLRSARLPQDPTLPRMADVYPMQSIIEQQECQQLARDVLRWETSQPFDSLADAEDVPTILVTQHETVEGNMPLQQISLKQRERQFAATLRRLDNEGAHDLDIDSLEVPWSQCSVVQEDEESVPPHQCKLCHTCFREQKYMDRCYSVDLNRVAKYCQQMGLDRVRKVVSARQTRYLCPKGCVKDYSRHDNARRHGKQCPGPASEPSRRSRGRKVCRQRQSTSSSRTQATAGASSGSRPRLSQQTSSQSCLPTTTLTVRAHSSYGSKPSFPTSDAGPSNIDIHRGDSEFDIDADISDLRIDHLISEPGRSSQADEQRDVPMSYKGKGKAPARDRRPPG